MGHGLTPQQTASENGPKLPLHDAASLRTTLEIDTKVNILRARMNDFERFENLALPEFRREIPQFQHLMLLIGQSCIDISCTLLMDYTGAVPRSYVHIMGSCARHRLLPDRLVGRLCRQLILISNGYDRLDESEIEATHRDVAESGKVFRRFSEHVQGRLDSQRLQA
ncbi:hypothetical protein HQ520_13365 [bacterium]|nr:hypothetical protein [bacterium]